MFHRDNHKSSLHRKDSLTSLFFPSLSLTHLTTKQNLHNEQRILFYATEKIQLKVPFEARFCYKHWKCFDSTNFFMKNYLNFERFFFYKLVFIEFFRNFTFIKKINYPKIHKVHLVFNDPVCPHKILWSCKSFKPNQNYESKKVKSWC